MSRNGTKWPKSTSDPQILILEPKNLASDQNLTTFSKTDQNFDISVEILIKIVKILPSPGRIFNDWIYVILLKSIFCQILICQTILQKFHRILAKLIKILTFCRNFDKILEIHAKNVDFKILVKP